MTKTTQYKNTPIGPIPKEWNGKKFYEFSKFYSGGTPLTSKPEYYGGEIPFIKSGEIYYNKTEQFLTEEGLNNSSAKMVSKGDLLYALYGANSGEVAISKLEGAINQAILCINHNKSEADTIYLYNYLIFQKDVIINKYLQGGQGNLSADIIKKLDIPLPPLPEQQKIAEVLSTWDKAIQDNDALIKKLEKRNKALANKLFTENNWKTFRLSELFDRITDKNSEGNTTVTTISARHGFIRQEDFFNKTVASKDLSNYYLINKGDFCYNKSYSKGYDWGVVKRLNDFEKAVVTTLYICFRFKDKSQNADFWELYFENGILDKGLSKVAQEGGRAHGLLNVTSGDFFSIQVKVPSLEEQNAIAAILNTANDELKQYQQKLETLKLQKKGLMQQLLTGKVRTI